jgi:hypothetical protein
MELPLWRRGSCCMAMPLPHFMQFHGCDPVTSKELRRTSAISAVKKEVNIQKRPPKNMFRTPGKILATPVNLKLSPGLVPQTRRRSNNFRLFAGL